jgi:hypothetical protein
MRYGKREVGSGNESRMSEVGERIDTAILKQ